MKQNLAATEVKLTQEGMLVLSKLDRNRRYYTGTGWAIQGSPYTMETL